MKTLGRAWVETAIVHLETVARVEARDHTDQPVTQVGDGDGAQYRVNRGQGGGWVRDCRYARDGVFVCISIEKISTSPGWRPNDSGTCYTNRRSS